jgi:hypothetical protein
MLAFSRIGLYCDSRQIERKIKAYAEGALDVNLGIEDVLYKLCASIDRQSMGLGIRAGYISWFFIDAIAEEQALFE